MYVTLVQIPNTYLIIWSMLSVYHCHSLNFASAIMCPFLHLKYTSVIIPFLHFKHTFCQQSHPGPGFYEPLPLQKVENRHPPPFLSSSPRITTKTERLMQGNYVSDISPINLHVFLLCVSRNRNATVWKNKIWIIFLWYKRGCTVWKCLGTIIIILVSSPPRHEDGLSRPTCKPKKDSKPCCYL